MIWIAAELPIPQWSQMLTLWELVIFVNGSASTGVSGHRKSNKTQPKLFALRPCWYLDQNPSWSAIAVEWLDSDKLSSRR